MVSKNIQKMKITDKIEVTNEDNMILMSRFPDNFFDLAIVDPPYGMRQMGAQSGGKGDFKNRIYNNGSIDNWDIAPNQSYFDELFRISKNQIIWGGNYFNLKPTRCVIVWDKCQPWENFSQVEIGWTSFESPAQLFKFDNRTGNKIHPTQKPVELYKWILNKYAKPGDKIIDTHFGSGSIAIACHDYSFELTACEIDVEFYKKSIQRIKNHVSQIKLFEL